MSPRIPVTATNLAEWVRRVGETVNRLLGRTETLERAAATPPARESFTFIAAPLPSSPAPGMVVFDEADFIHKAWDGTAWHALY